MDTAVKITNTLSKIFVNTLFRKNYSPQTMRRNMNLLGDLSRLVVKGKTAETEVESVIIDGVPAEIISTRKGQDKILMLLHGGGYFMGTLRSFRRIALEVSHTYDLKVILLEYRLAPEFPYPAALEDAKKGYLFARTRFAGQQVIVGGDSAGGGLALALTMALRDEKQKLPDKVFVVSPWANLLVAGESVEKNKKNDFWLSETTLRKWGADYYQMKDPKDPYVSPLFGDFSKFPPMMIFSGDQEILATDAEKVYEQAKKAGVDVKLHVGKDMQHDWLLAFPFLKEARRAEEKLREFLNG